MELARTGKTDGVRLSFNGVELDVLQLGDALAEYSFPIPAALWSRTSNELRLETVSGKGVVLMGPLTITPGEAYDRRAQTLDPGVTVTWELLLRDGGLLDLDVTARAAGTLTVDFRLGAPGTAPGAAVQTDVFSLTTSERFPVRVPLPAPGRDLLHVTLAWQADSGQDAALELHAVRVFEDTPFERPPVLFVSVDTLAAQNMSLYGYDRETTPRLAAFAEDCVTFTAARANAPWTVPSYTSQLTGLYPAANRLTAERRKELGVPMGVLDYRVPQSRTTLAEQLQAMGYRTAAFVDNPWLGNVPGVRQGFDVFDTTAAKVELQNPEMGMRYVLPAGRSFLEPQSADSRPPFAFIQILDVHGPYMPHPPFEGRFATEVEGSDPDPLPVVETPHAIFGTVPSYIASQRLSSEGASEVSGAALRADYDEKVLELDAFFGEFIDELHRSGLYDQTVIVFSADHGESMEDHDFYFRHGLAYDSAIHVPLMVKLPGQQHGGSAVTTPVQLVDLYSTILELAGQDAAWPGHGRSLVPALRGGALDLHPVYTQSNLLRQASLVHGTWKLIASAPREATLEALLTFPPFQERFYEREREVFVELFNGPPPVEPSHIVATCQALEREDPGMQWELLQALRTYEPHLELYDLEADPFETHDVASAHPERVAKLRELLTEESARATPYRNFEEVGPIALGDEMKAELEALGYVTD